MRTGAWLLAGFLALGTALASEAAYATEGSSVESGSWNEPAVGSVTIPSTTPSGQLQVSYGFRGPLEISAVRFTLPAGTDPADQVTIRLATAGAMVGAPTVSACPTTSRWKPSDSGAPAYSCENARQAVGALTGTAESWTFPAAWASRGVIAVALVPAVGTASPFSISYTAPTTQSITVAPPAATPAPSNPGGVPANPPVTVPTSVSVPAGPPATIGNPVPVGVTGSGSVAVGSGASAPVPNPNFGSLPTSANSSSGSSGPTAVAAPASQPAGAGIVSAPGRRRGARILAFCLLVATGAALFRAAGRGERPAHSLLPHRYGIASPEVATASGTPATVRGIGRFARVRTGPPTRI